MKEPLQRPDPDALARAASREERGQLKVFLGAAPGVGKTFEMLSQGAQRRLAGADVVIGIVETHGRAETQALTGGYEIVARREIDHQGRVLTELDLDAILSRHPQLVLIDELAHTNAAGSRHPKRYQDIEELLDAKIDVYTTVNIQHIESLNDVVASFTHVRVRETVPDRILEAAEIEVVDLPPDELIERLKAGKVYIPDEATRALGHFFSKSNLSALRELALRRAAQAVDAQMLDYVRSHALAGNWAAGERIVVAVNELPGADALVRAAKRIADAQRAPWTALYVDTPRAKTFSEEQHKRLASVLNLASELGGTIVASPATSAIEGLKTHLAEARATQLIVGKSARSRWFELRHGSVVDRLVRETPGVAIHVLPLGEDATQSPPHSRTPVSTRSSGAYLWSALMVAAITGLATILAHVLNLANVALLYLLPVMVAASLFGLRAGLFAGIASSLAYNFFFLPPTGTLTVSNPENVVTIVVLLGVALVTSQFAARVRVQADIASSSASANAALAGFLRELSTLATDEDVVRAIATEIARLFEVRTILVGPSDEGPLIRAAAPPEDELGTIELAAARWSLDTGQLAGRGSDTLTASDWLFFPLRAGSRVLAAIGLARDDGREPVRSDRVPLLLTMLDQAALVLERMRLEDEMRDVAQLRERDRLRAALLSSVSHDLRTPLTSITAAAAQLPDGEHVATIRAESERLNRFIANLLDMARVEAGALKLSLEPTDLTDAIGAAIHDTRASLSGHKIDVRVPPDLPLVRVDPRLFHHCLINLLDNAGRYADEAGPITVEATEDAGQLILSILDEGPGLPLGRESMLFEMFHRVKGSDRAKTGTGLGLAIVKGFAEAMGLIVEAATRLEPRGARFSIRIPESHLIRDMVSGEAA